MIDIYIENGMLGYLVTSLSTDEFDNGELRYDFVNSLKEARLLAKLRGDIFYLKSYRIIEHIRPLTIPNSLMATKKTYPAKKKAVVKKAKKVVKAKKK